MYLRDQNGCLLWFHIYWKCSSMGAFIYWRPGSKRPHVFKIILWMHIPFYSQEALSPFRVPWRWNWYTWNVHCIVSLHVRARLWWQLWILPFNCSSSLLPLASSVSMNRLRRCIPEWFALELAGPQVLRGASTSFISLALSLIPGRLRRFRLSKQNGEEFSDLTCLTL